MSERVPTIKVKTDDDHKIINAADHKEGDVLAEKPSEEATAILRKLPHAESIQLDIKSAEEGEEVEEELDPVTGEKVKKSKKHKGQQ